MFGIVLVTPGSAISFRSDLTKKNISEFSHFKRFIVLQNANICNSFSFLQSCWYFAFGDYRGSLHHLCDAGVKRVGSTAGHSQLTYHRQSEFWIPEATLRFWGQWWSTKGQYYMPKGERRLFWALFFSDSFRSSSSPAWKSRLWSWETPGTTAARWRMSTACWSRGSASPSPPATRAWTAGRSGGSWRPSSGNNSNFTPSSQGVYRNKTYWIVLKSLLRFTAKHQDTVQDVLRKAEKEWNWWYCLPGQGNYTHNRIKDKDFILDWIVFLWCESHLNPFNLNSPNS